MPRGHHQQSKLIAHIVIAFNTNCPVAQRIDRHAAESNVRPKAIKLYVCTRHEYTGLFGFTTYIITITTTTTIITTTTITTTIAQTQHIELYIYISAASST